jgi:hypothetical protein
MVTPAVVRAFRSVGWGWGGRLNEGLHALLGIWALAARVLDVAVRCGTLLPTVSIVRERPHMHQPQQVAGVLRTSTDVTAVFRDQEQPEHTDRPRAGCSSATIATASGASIPGVPQSGESRTDSPLTGSPTLMFGFRLC